MQSGEADVALLPPEIYSRPGGDPASGSMGMLIYIGEADATDERIA